VLQQHGRRAFLAALAAVAAEVETTDCEDEAVLANCGVANVLATGAKAASEVNL
jgi:hypothetical protein